MRLAERIKAWVFRVFGLSGGVVVTVMELRCHEPGCPLAETAIAILGASGSPQPYKVHKPMSEVTFQDVERLASGDGVGAVGSREKET